ncbi:hypothetical protein Btru_039993 [Bulinus truncatus]|nr:hypothetical protein Btru_039993 [Bulinus truncatus]
MKLLKLSGTDCKMAKMVHEMLDPNNESVDGDRVEGRMLTITQMLSSTLVVTTMVSKLPQIKNIVCSGSTMSISLSSVVIEWLAYTVMLTYQYAMGYPHYTFFESNATVLQDFILILLILKHRNLIEVRILPFYALYVIFFIVMCSNLLPQHIMLVVISATTPMLVWSKVNQLMTIWRNETAGSVSAITWLIAVYNTAVRILTTVAITKDFPMFINLGSSEFLNVAVLMSILYYRLKRGPQRHVRRPRRR